MPAVARKNQRQRRIQIAVSSPWTSRKVRSMSWRWESNLASQSSAVVDPSTGEEYARAPVSGPADVEAALRAAAGAFEVWRETTPAERSLALLRMADAYERDTEWWMQAPPIASR